MFSFTKRADYALLALSYLTTAAIADSARLINTKEIAEHHHIPVELLAKIMQVLARSGMVESYPGPTGGYRILRDPSMISIAEVVNIIDGQLGIVHCSGGNETGCEQFSRCTIRNPLSEIEARMNRLLQQMSIREICQ
jgi:Rrf2 family protein